MLQKQLQNHKKHPPQKNLYDEEELWTSSDEEESDSSWFGMWGTKTLGGKNASTSSAPKYWAGEQDSDEEGEDQVAAISLDNPNL